jgi:thymidine kinase
MCGKLELILGPMFSGKSTELIRRIRLFQQINKKVLVLKPQIDSRYLQNKITSHNYESVDCVVLNNLRDINEDELIKYNVVIIDEGQFFSDLVEYVKWWVDELNLDTIVGGLDGDFERKPFGTILNLIPYADSCNKLTSLCNICKDGTTAPFSFRINQTKEQVLVGGSESYIPLCRKHYNELSKN